MTEPPTLSTGSVLFVDRSLGGRLVPAELRRAGHEVRTHDETFPPDTEDEVWLRRAGAEGWTVLMKDDRIRYRRREWAAVEEAGVRCFTLTNANLASIIRPTSGGTTSSRSMVMEKR